MIVAQTEMTADAEAMVADATAYVWPAQIVIHNDGHFLVTHAPQMVLGTIPAPGGEIAALIMLEPYTGRGLAQTYTVAEMRSLGTRLLGLADTFEANADQAATTALDRARKAPR